MTNQFFRSKKREEKELKEKVEAEVRGFINDVEEVQAKHGYCFRAIINENGPRIVVDKIPEVELQKLKEKFLIKKEDV